MIKCEEDTFEGNISYLSAIGAELCCNKNKIMNALMVKNQNNRSTKEGY